MDLKRIAKDTTKTLVSYLTYQAVRTVAAQLRETNPSLYTWFHNFSSATTIQDGEAYLRELMQVNQDLALRVMTVRAHLAEEVADYLPEMLRAGVQQANMEHRRSYLERITSLEMDGDVSDCEPLTSGVAEGVVSEVRAVQGGDRQSDAVSEERGGGIEANSAESTDPSDTDLNPESSEW